MTGVAGPLTKSLPVCVFDSASFAFNGELLFCLQQQKSNQKNAATDDCAPVFHTGIPAEAAGYHAVKKLARVKNARTQFSRKAHDIRQLRRLVKGGFKSTAKTESKQVAIVCINQDVSP